MKRRKSALFNITIWALKTNIWGTFCHPYYHTGMRLLWSLVLYCGTLVIRVIRQCVNVKYLWFMKACGFGEEYDSYQNICSWYSVTGIVYSRCWKSLFTNTHLVDLYQCNYFNIDIIHGNKWWNCARGWVLGTSCLVITQLTVLIVNDDIYIYIYINLNLHMKLNRIFSFLNFEILFFN